MEKKIKSAKEAKELSSKEWHLIAEKGLKSKRELPLELYNKIKNLKAQCPLCELFQFDTGKTYTNCEGFITPITGLDCAKCPLGKADQECNTYLECYHPNHSSSQYICIECFYKRDYYTQWQYANKLFCDKELTEVMKKAANGIADIIDDWEI